jgi:hypothetical protein
MKIVSTADSRLLPEARNKIKSSLRRTKNKQVSYAKWGLLINTVNTILLGYIAWQLLKV